MSNREHSKLFKLDAVSTAFFSDKSQSRVIRDLALQGLSFYALISLCRESFLVQIII